MPTLISAGVSVTVTDESFFIPASAPTVPLFFIASRANKFQPNGISVAAGTNEHSIIRTVTSLGQSTQLYGIPTFLKDYTGAECHGDARNEYGLFALNQFLGVGNRAFVIRANIDLRDEPVANLAAAITGTPSHGNGVLTKTVTDLVISDGGTGYATTPTVQFTSTSGTGAAADAIVSGGIVTGYTITNGGTGYTSAPLVEFIGASTTTALATSVVSTDILVDQYAVSEVWTIAFTSPTTYNVIGTVSGLSGAGTVNTLFDNNDLVFTIRSGTTAFIIGDEFEITITSSTSAEPLGLNDAAKRVAITTALQAQINSNTEVRSEYWEFNLLLCPGYPEVADELLALSVAIQDEAFVIADCPMTKDADQVAYWANTSERFHSSSIAYYYPSGLASNLDGHNVVCAASGIALRTITYSDNVSEIWFAPAGMRRGMVTGVSMVGYVSGTLGTATTFNETNLNQGQRDNLYEYYKNVNPIVFFPGRGLIVWGQKTSSGAASALDRVNVSREMMYIKRSIRKASMPFVFEPNDQLTRDNLKAMIDGFLGDILVRRGLYDFVTLCNDHNNTPVRIDRNELWCDVALKPVKSAEFLYIPIRVLSTGATMPS